MHKQTTHNVTGTVGDFVNTLVTGQKDGTEQEKVYKALAVLESNGVLTSAQVSKFKDEYANGDFIVH